MWALLLGEETTMDPEHPSMFLLGVLGMQGPSSYLPGLLLRVVSAASNFEVRDSISFHKGGFLPLTIKAMTPLSSVFLSCNMILCQ